MKRRSFSSALPGTAFWGAIFLTAIFVVFLVIAASWPVCEINKDGYSACHTKLVHFVASPPNEMGDAIAGIAGSLALIWLAASVIIQRSELSATVEEMREATRLSRERFSLREFELLLRSTLDAFASAGDAEAWYGEWAFRVAGREDREHTWLRVRTKDRGGGVEELMPRIFRNVYKTYQAIHNRNYRIDDRPKRLEQHKELKENLWHLLVLQEDLPSHEKRQITKWKIKDAYEMLDDLLKKDEIWDLGKDA